MVEMQSARLKRAGVVRHLLEARDFSRVRLHNHHHIYTGNLCNGGLYVVAERFEIDIATLCACTGLKDKNGKLIWENDIVRDDNGNLYKAFWQDRYYQFSWICVKSDKLPIGAKWDFWSIRSYEIEVIGNIFDDPELLNLVREEIEKIFRQIN